MDLGITDDSVQVEFGAEKTGRFGAGNQVVSAQKNKSIWHTRQSDQKRLKWQHSAPSKKTTECQIIITFLWVTASSPFVGHSL